MGPFNVIEAMREKGVIQFTPFNYTANDNIIMFFVQGDETIQSIRSLSKRLPVQMHSEKSKLPPIEINQLIDKLKIVMGKRYDSNNKLLDLTHLSSEKDFLDIYLYVSLERNDVCEKIVEIIIGNIPDLIGLNLSNNKIQNLDNFKPLVSVCKNLKQIDLSYNNVSDF